MPFHFLMGQPRQSAETPGENKSNRLNNQAIQPKSLREEILQGAGIKGKNSSPGIAGQSARHYPEKRLRFIGQNL